MRPVDAGSRGAPCRSGDRATCGAGRAALALPGGRLYHLEMRILYGVVGEGMGHAMRSRVVLEHLFASGHEVEIMASGRAAEFLRKAFAARGWVHRIHGMHIVYE